MNYIAKTVTKSGAILEAEFSARSQDGIRKEAEKAMQEQHGTSKVMAWSPVLQDTQHPGRRILLSILVIAAVAQLCCPQQSYASEFSAFGAAGIVKYEHPDRGLWAQKQGGFQTHDDYQAKSFRVGGEWGTENLGLRLWYTYIKKYSMDAYATSAEDCANTGGSDAVSRCGGAVSKFMTDGSMRFIGLSAIARTPEFFGMRLTGELGGGRVRQAFHLVVSNNDATPCYEYSERLWGPGKMAAIGLQFNRDRTTISAAYYESGVAPNFNKGAFPSGVNFLYMLAIEQRFKGL